VATRRVELPCIHLGKATGETVKCDTCLGEVHHPLYCCAVYGETLGQKQSRRKESPHDPYPSCFFKCPGYVPDTFKLIAPLGTGKNISGVALKKPWQYRSTAILPTLGETDHLPILLDLLRLQTEPPYIVIVDTGSPQSQCDKLERLRADDVEIHYVRGNAYTNTSEPVCVALDLGFARANTELIFLTRTDCFPVRRDALEWMGAQVSAETPVVGWEMSDRSWITDKWRGVVSHTFTMIDAKTVRRIGATWHMQRSRDSIGAAGNDGWPDTETGFDLCLKAAGIKPKLLGEEFNYQRQITEWWDHARSLTGLRTYSAGNDMANAAEVYAAAAVEEAAARAKLWRQGH
jgi:hypothetical protein